MVPSIASAALRPKAALAAAAALVAIATGVGCAHQPQHTTGTDAAQAFAPVKLLTAHFTARAIHKIEVGDFHFTPGQVAPVHTHAAPALGYVSKGSIVYQVEGQPVQLLQAGDAFYEPVGPRILHFDNGSATEEAIFTDFNFERAGEPFIVFPTPPVDVKVDRRTFPTVELESGPDVRGIEIFAETIAPGAAVERLAKPLPVMGYVVEGAIEIHAAARSSSIAAGHSFDVPAGQAPVTLKNASPDAAAKIVTFEPVL